MQMFLNNYFPTLIQLVLFIFLPLLITKAFKLHHSRYIMVAIVSFFLIWKELHILFMQTLQITIHQNNLEENIFFLSLITYFIPVAILYLLVRKNNVK